MKTIEYYIIVYAVTTIIWGIFLLLKKRHSREAHFFSFFIFFSSVWIIIVSLANLSDSALAVIFLTRLCYLFAIFSVIFFLFFSIVFREKKIFSHNRKLLATISAVSFVFIFLILFLPNERIYTNVVIHENNIPEGDIGLICFLVSFFLFFLLVYSSIILFENYKQLSGHKKSQIKYVVIGFALYSIGAIFFSIILPFFGEERFYNFGQLSSVFFIGLTSYAIAKHQLLDIKVVIQRSIIYSVSLGLIIGFYISLLFIFEYLFGFLAQEKYIFSAGITILLGIYGTPVIEKYFRKKTDKIFFKDKYDYAEAVYEMTEIINRNIDLRKLVSKIANKLKSILRVEFVEIILPGYNLFYDRNNNFRRIEEGLPYKFFKLREEQNMIVFDHSGLDEMIKNAKKKDDVDLIQSLCQAKEFTGKYRTAISVAILLKGRNIGLINIGRKLSGDFFNREDFGLLKVLSRQSAIALEKADLYEQIKSYSKELERKVEKRTAELKNIQESQKQMMLEIAHGLQTPLTIIKGELSVLYDQIKNNKKILALEKTIDRASKFIYDMLKLSYIEAINEQTIKKKKINLSELVSELIESYEIIAEQQNIKIKNKIQPNVFIIADKSVIEDLLTNLVSNSMKYMSDTGPKIIAISLFTKDKYVILEVEDNGIGISKAYLPYIFNRFYRINISEHSAKRGTGLGLAICKKIIEKYNGSIKAESSKGKGTKFIVRLPYKK